MFDTAVNRIRVDIVSADGLEVSIRVGGYRAVGVAQRAADVHVNIVKVDDEARIIAAPRTLNHQIAGRCRCRGGARDRRDQ